MVIVVDDDEASENIEVIWSIMAMRASPPVVVPAKKLPYWQALLS